MPDLPTGVYEQPLTDDLMVRLEGLRHISQQVGEAAASASLADYVTQALFCALEDLPAEERVSRANALLADLGSRDRVIAGPKQLLAVAREEEPGVWRLLQTRPRVPFSRPALHGRTDRHALDRLVRDFGAAARVNYETRSTRLLSAAANCRPAIGGRCGLRRSGDCGATADPGIGRRATLA